MLTEKGQQIKLQNLDIILRRSRLESRVRSSLRSPNPSARGVNSPHSKTSKSVRDTVFDILNILDDLRECSSSKLEDKKRPPTTNPTPKSQSKKVIVRVDADCCEALVDELMCLVDFGQAIDEPVVELAGERCLFLIGEGVSGNER